MKNSPKLFICIEDLEISLIIGHIDEQNDFKFLEKLSLSFEGTIKNKISDLDKFTSIVKKNILLIEKKINYTFKDIIIILDIFEISFLNLCGFKKLNGTQISKENIIYILNSLKSYINEFEENKKILHIFNSEYLLDDKKLDNLPIGLFGDFYSQELSFNMMSTNDYNNLKQIFDKCNLKIEKVLIKSFIESVYINHKHNIETFFLIKINNHNSKISFFENASLKFEQVFNFGIDIVFSDISKITSLKMENVKHIMEKVNLIETLSEEEIIEKEFFSDNNYKKIKKKLIYEIAFARIQEISELIIFKNINLKYHNKVPKKIFLDVKSQSQDKGLIKIFESVFSLDYKLDLKLVTDSSNANLVRTTNDLLQFGWKKEAIPVALSKKSILKRFFEAFFS